MFSFNSYISFSYSDQLFHRPFAKLVEVKIQIYCWTIVKPTMLL